MLFKVLKLFGLDIPAKIEAAKASLELHVAQATDHVKQVAQEAAVIAALSAFAALAAAMAAGVGLIALYRWTADAYGVYAGLGVVGAILLAATVIFATAAALKGQLLAADRIKLPRHAICIADVSSDPGVITGDFAADAGTSEPHAGAYSSVSPTTAMSAAPAASPSDLAEPLAFFLSKFVKYPRIGNPAVDELIGSLRATAHGTADEAIACAANVVRHGNRTNLIVVLAGAAAVGWLLTHHSRQQSLNS